jgi:hypothetical protein
LNAEDFNMIVDDCAEKMKATLQKKSGEYSRGGDRFHNFKVAGRRRDMSPERALAGMKEKQCVSVEDIIDDIDNGVLPTMAMLDEKFGDEINYLVLLKGLIIERIRKVDNDFLKNIPGAIEDLIETNKNTRTCDDGALYYGVGLSKRQAKRISDALKYKFGKKRSLVTLPDMTTSIPPKKSTKKKVGKK